MPNRVRFVDPGIIVQSGGGSGGGTSISSSYALSASYADYAVSASHEIVKEVSSSYADFALSSSHAITASYALNAGTGGGDSDWYNGGTFITSSVPALITGSLQVTGSYGLIGTPPTYPLTLRTVGGGIQTVGTLYIDADSKAGTTARIMLGTSNVNGDIARLNDNTLVIGGETQYYGWRIFGIKHGANGGLNNFTTEIDNLIATGSMRVSGSLDISLPSGSAFTIRENDKPENIDDRLEFEFSDGDPTLRIISQGTGVSTIRLQNEESAPTTGVTINQSGQFRLNDDNGFTIANPSATEFNLSPIVGSPASNTNNLGNNTRPWSNLYVYNGIGYSTGGGAGSFNSKRFNIRGENRNTGLFNYGQMSLQYSGSVTDTLDNPLNHFFGIRLSSDYTPTSIRERLIFSVGKSGSLGINLNQGKTGMLNPYGANYTFYTASAMVHVEAEPNYSLNLFQGNDVNGNNVFEVDRDGNLTVDAQISASGDLYARDGRFSRDGGAAEIEIIASEAAGGIVGTQTNDNLILRRFNIPKFTISESRNYSHTDLEINGGLTVSGPSYFESGSITLDTTTLPSLPGNNTKVNIGVGGSGAPYKAFQIYTNAGFVVIGPQNDTYSHFTTDRSKFYFNKPLQVSGEVMSHVGEDLVLGNNGGTSDTITIAQNDIIFELNNQNIFHMTTGSAGGILSGSASSTASFGTYLGDGSQLTNLPIQDPFPYIGDAIISGSLSISGSLLNTGTVSIDHTDSPYTLTGTQQFVLIDPSGGNVTINMPDAATYPGRQIFFKLTQAAGANTVTLQRQGSDTIDGATTYTDLDVQYESISVVSNGSNGWFIF